MAALTVIPLLGTLGILFIGFNVLIITLLILTIVFGVIRLVKKKFTKTFNYTTNFNSYFCIFRL